MDLSPLWKPQGLCTTNQQPADRGRSVEFMLRATVIRHGDQGQAISVKELAEDLSRLADLATEDGLP